MFVKTVIFALTAFVATTAADEVWNGFAASWALNTSTHFYDLPKTLKAAKTEGWTYISGVNPPKGITPLGFYDDPTFVLLFKKGEAIGFQIAMLAEEVDTFEQPMQWAKLDAIITKTLNQKLYYTATAYFHNDESKDVRKLWFQEKKGLREIPTNASLVPSETPYFLKNCIPTMGVHYYTWDTTSDCANLYPWFLLSHDGNTVGVGFQGFGTLAAIGEREWWEVIPAGAIYVAMSDPPTCAVDATAEFGAISLHVWLVDKPQTITCS